MTWAFFAELFIRSAFLLAGAAFLLQFSRNKPAAFRHKLLLSSFGFLAALPFLPAVLPVISVPLTSPAAFRNGIVTTQFISDETDRQLARDFITWPAYLWLGGFVGALSPLLFGILAAFRLSRTAVPFQSAAFSEFKRELDVTSQDAALVVSSSHVRAPLACGILRPRVLLPPDGLNWSFTRLRAVLSHEFAHIHRRDVAAQILCHVLAAMWWFQPLAWILLIRLRRESELACDLQALAAGMKPSEYAEELLALAKITNRTESLSSFAISMARPNSLEERLQVILSSPTRLVIGGKPYVAVLLLTSVATAAALTVRTTNSSDSEGGSIVRKTILAALMGSASLSAATVSGSVVGPAGEAISDAKVIVYNPDTAAKQEVVTDAGGRFSVSGAGAGQYILRIEKAPFASTFRVFSLRADSRMSRQITMTASGGEQTPDQVSLTPEDHSSPIRVGGNVAQNNLTTKVQPVYPPAAKAAGIQGTVEIAIHVTGDGIPSELRVASSPSDDLSQSALEAVRQWRYRPTLLNGNPVPIVSTVVVNYTLAR